MPLTLEQYATYLDSRDLPWPAPPDIEKPKAKPHLVLLPQVKAVTWGIYGTLLAIAGGDLYFEHPNQFIMDMALEKAIQEFKMWGSMTRTPGQPAEYLRPIYQKLLAELGTNLGSKEKHPEIAVDRLWEKLIKRLFQKDYQFDAGFYGSLNEFSRKVAYFFHASMQGTSCYEGAAAALKHVKAAGLTQALVGNGQCFTLVQLQRGLSLQDVNASVTRLIDPEFCALSFEVGVRQPSEKLFRHALAELAKHNISPEEVLHVGPRIASDVIPARRLGMKAALFAGDKASLEAVAAQLNEPNGRPDILMTELSQITEVICPS